MNKPNPTKKKKKEIIEPISKLLSFLDNNLPKFMGEFPYDKKNVNSMSENTLTEALVFFLINKVHREGFSFMNQTNQEGKRTVDIGVFLFGNRLNFIFCVEAKFLPHSPFDYVTGEYAAIKRYKAKEHGLNNCIEKIPLIQNGIVAYVKSGTFDEHFIKINEKIRGNGSKYSQQPDEFDLTWYDSEQLEKIYFKSIGKLFSKHPRQEAPDIRLHHFWIDVNEKDRQYNFTTDCIEVN